MPDILIRGMEKPGSCRECDFSEFHDINFEILYYCNRTERFIDEEEAYNIPPDCPIHELPEHGDLIDIRTILEIVMQYVPDDDGSCSKANADLRELLDEIENAPVIVPSNKEESK